jgi:hypothetical protein
MRERNMGTVAIPPGMSPAPRCGDCGRFFKARRAVYVELWRTSPTPEPMDGWLYCNECRAPEPTP